jgi:acetyltransferase-like isoleucine patch superfamily enzyme
MKIDWNGLFISKFRRTRLHYLRLYSTWIGKVNLISKNIQFGKYIVFYGKTYFYRAPFSTIVIGNNVEFRSDKNSNLIGICKMNIVSTLERGAEILIGDSSGFSGVSIGAAKRIVIGANVMVGANTVITDTNWHDIDPNLRHMKDSAPGFVTIEDNVFIGYGCIILKNVKIGQNSVIGAGSVVTKDIPANVIAAGNPCVVLKELK